MNFILSIILCFALALGGTGSLPAEPETAATWTIRNLTLSYGGESAAFSEEARITAAVGEEKAALHFELGSGEKVLLPLSAEITNDALRFALSDSGRAYSFTNATFYELAEFDEDDVKIMNALADFFINYGALLGIAYSADEQAQAYSETVTEILLSTCGAEPVPVEIAYDGQTLDAQQVEINLTYESIFALLDALRGCGFPELERALDDLLDIFNGTMYASYESFTALAMDMVSDEELEYSFPITMTFANDGELVYYLVDTALEDVDDFTVQMREEVVARGEEVSVDANMVMDLGITSANYVIRAQMTGPFNAPAAMHMDYDIIANTAVPSADEGYSYTSDMVWGMTFDLATNDGLRDARFAMNYDFSANDSTNSFQLIIAAAERGEDDGSVTADVAIDCAVEDQVFGATFEINRTEAAPADYFDGLNIYDLDAETIDSLSNNEESETAVALRADVSRMALDAMQLATSEGVQAVGEMITNIAAAEYNGDMGEEDYDSEDEYTARPVASLEEAAKIFDGDLLDFTPPEGYEITEISASSYSAYITYASEEGSFELSTYAYSGSGNNSYVLTSDGLVAVTDPIVELIWIDEDTIGYATMSTPDGDYVSFNFYDGVDLDTLSGILAGVN